MLQKSDFPRLFWKSRAGAQTPFHFYGQSFYPDGCQGVWSAFPSQLHQISDQKIVMTLPHQSLPRAVRREDTPSFEEWKRLVLDACQKIRKEEFDKVVLARRTTLVCEGLIPADEILQRLSQLKGDLSLYLVHIDPTTAFVGATPEQLFSRVDRSIQTEALAGTVASQEVWSAKEHREIDAVRSYLNDSLHSYCDHLKWGPLEERSFGQLRHLYQQVTGTLKNNITDRELIQRLHPTPALGGFPQKAALDYVRSVEPFDRGWYGAPIGTLSDHKTDLAVAIRCGLIQGSAIHLFAGAGIVAGSDPHQEWNELDRKINHLLLCF